MSEVPEGVRDGGDPDRAGDDVRRAALGTEFDDDAELTGSPDQPSEAADTGGQDSGSMT